MRVDRQGPVPTSQAGTKLDQTRQVAACRLDADDGSASSKVNSCDEEVVAAKEGKNEFDKERCGRGSVDTHGRQMMNMRGRNEQAM